MLCTSTPVKIAAIAAAGLLLAGLGLHAANRQLGAHFGGHAGSRGHGPLERMAGILDLNETQKDQIRAEVKAEWPELQPRIKAVVEAHRALLDAARSEKSDEAAIRASAETLAKTEAELAIRFNQLHRRIRPLLTDAQQKKCDRLHEILRRLVDDHLDMADVALGS